MNALRKSGDDDIRTMDSLNDMAIDSLTFDRSDIETDVPLPRSQKDLLHIFKHYVWHCYATENPIEDNWTSISADDFDAYHTGPDYLDITLGFTPQPHIAVTRGVYTSHSPLHSITCGPSLFMTFKDGKQSDSWQHSTVAQAHAQDGVEVLNTNHVPGAQNENDHFQEKQATLASSSPCPKTVQLMCLILKWMLSLVIHQIICLLLILQLKGI